MEEPRHVGYPEMSNVPSKGEECQTVKEIEIIFT